MLYKPYFLLCLLPLGVLIMGCQSQNTTTEMTNKTTPVSPAKVYPTMGKIEYLDDRLKDIIPEQAVIERIAEGLTWAEGPLWVTSHQMLLFSDVKENKIFKWTEKDSLQLYLSPSGFTGENTDSREPGSNGLTLDPAGNLVMCQHANRQIARMDAPLDAPEPKFESLAATYDGKRLNSPTETTSEGIDRIRSVQAEPIAQTSSWSFRNPSFECQ
ncbi:MAG: SMP-30/gluconolactonase/LRE family protein, partial [Chitinophagales bacterium]